MTSFVFSGLSAPRGDPDPGLMFVVVVVVAAAVVVVDAGLVNVVSVVGRCHRCCWLSLSFLLSFVLSFFLVVAGCRCLSLLFVVCCVLFVVVGVVGVVGVVVGVVVVVFCFCYILSDLW